MATYAVGDVQGCYGALSCVLERAGFERARDHLWLVGDLVNRGPESLDVLRFVHSLGNRARVVLGNHEIHLLAVAAGERRLKPSDTLDAILAAPDRPVLLGWLAQQPLLYVDRDVGYCMSHAGIPPQWDLVEAQAMAQEAERWLALHGYGQIATPSREEAVELAPGQDEATRARVIVSYFTRMRVCTPSGVLDLRFKGPADQAPPGHLPWFAHSARKTANERIVFGHWAALEGKVDAANVFALDTGCAWGRSLTLMRLDDERRFSCPCVSLRRANESGSGPGQA
jgi:bis(5'-nucleosyl)-tetraphosphatase (symmetrical)